MLTLRLVVLDFGCGFDCLVALVDVFACLWYFRL